MKKILWMAARVVFSFALLAFLFSKIDFWGTLKIIAKADLYYFFLAAGTFAVIYIFGFYRWKMLLDAQKVDIPPMRIFNSFSGGVFFNLFLPSTIGGDVARSVDLSIHTKRRSIIVATVLLDRLSGFVGLVLIALAALAFGSRFIDEPSVYATVFIITGLLAAVLLFIFNNGIHRWMNGSSRKEGGIADGIRKLHAEMYFFRSRPWLLVLNLVYSLIIQGSASLFSYYVLRGFGSNIKLFYPFVLNPVVTVISMLPVSIGGLGLRDASSVFFYAKAGVAKDVALAQSLVSFAFIVFFGLLGGAAYVLTLHYRRVQPDKTGPRA